MSKKIDFFDGSQTSTAPTLGNISATDLADYASDAAYEAANAGAPSSGNIYHRTTDGAIRHYNGSAWETVAVLPIDLTDTVNDPAGSTLVATTGQAAVDELDGKVETNETNIATNASDIATNAGDIDDLETLSGSPGATDHGTFSGATIPDNSTTKAALQSLETEVEAKVDSSSVGAANGVASLDGSGKLPVSQLPDSALEYLGSFDPTGPTPNLQNGTGNTGDFYRVSVAGSHDFGAGSVSLAQGDSVIYNGSTWDKYDEQTLADTDALPEGSTNLYNQTHTGEVTGATALTVDPAAITNKTTTTPESGDFFLFSDTSDSGNLKKANFDDLGSGGGSGSGRLNFVLNPDFTDDINEVVGYDDAAGTPVDGDGGSLTNLAISHETVSPLSKGGFLRIARSADSQGEGVRLNLDTVGDNVREGLVEIEFDYRVDANILDGDFGVYVYDVSNATMTKVINDDEGDILASNNKFRGVYYATTSGLYRLLIHAQTTTATSGNLDIDNVVFGPSVSVPRTIPRHTEPVDATVAFTNNTATFNVIEAKFWREGNQLRYRGRVDFTSAGSGAGSFRLNMPAEVTAEFGTLTFLSQQYNGNATFYNLDTHINIFRNNSATYDQANSGWQFIKDESGGVVQGVSIRNLTQFYFDLHVRVQEWEDQKDALISTTENLFKNAYADYGNSSAISLTAFTTPIPFNTVRQDDLGVWDGSQFTALADGIFIFNGMVVLSAVNSNLLLTYVDGANQHGAGSFDNRSVAAFNDIRKMKKGETWDIRVNNAATSANNSINQLNISGIPDTSAFGVFGKTALYESAVATAVWSPGISVWGDVTSITVPPGEYDLVFNAFVNNASGNSATWSIGIDETSGNSAPGSGINGVDSFDLSLTTGFNGTIVAHKPGVVVTQTTTFYAKARFNTSSGGIIGGRIYARKVK